VLPPFVVATEQTVDEETPKYVPVTVILNMPLHEVEGVAWYVFFS
jgi:hypothetical protein